MTRYWMCSQETILIYSHGYVITLVEEVGYCQVSYSELPSGKLTQLWKITIFNG